MPIFEYTAYDKKRNLVKDQITADNERDVRGKIRDLGYFPIDVKAISATASSFTPSAVAGAVGSSMQRAVKDLRSIQERLGEEKPTLKQFSYTAQIIATGETVKGDVEASDLRAARQVIRSRNLYPLDIVEKKISLQDKGGIQSLISDAWDTLFPSRYKLKELAGFVRQLSTMLESGLSLVKALELVRRNVKDKALNETIGKVQVKLEEGSTLSRAFEEYGDKLPPSFLELVTAGESSGTLETNLKRLAEYLEKQIELRNRIQSSLTYPGFVILLVMAIALAMLIFVIPQFKPLFSEFKIELPWITKLMVFLSAYVTSFNFLWQAPLAIFFIFWLFRVTYRTPLGREFYQRILRAIPLIGPLIYKVVITRIVYTMSITISAGVSIRETLYSLSRSLDNIRIQIKLNEIRAGIEKGGQLSELCEKSELFPEVVIHLIRVGEETGNTDEMLERAANYLDQEVEQSVKQLLAAMEPLLTIVMGGVVFFMMGSIYLPIFTFITQGGSSMK